MATTKKNPLTSAAGGTADRSKPRHRSSAKPNPPAPRARSQGSGRRREGDNAAPVGHREALVSSKKVLTKTPTHQPPVYQDQPSVVTPWRVWMAKLTRFSPIRQLDPETLGRMLDQFAAGTLRYFALMMEAVALRDDVLQSVIPKRKAATARRGIEIHLDPDVPKEEAEVHAQKLRYFYKNALVTNAVDMNQKRGTSLLIEQILDAVMKKYAVHEIIWRVEEGGLTATFNFVPLWFFENRTGKLRFLLTDFAYDGVDLDDGAWMVSVGQGVMEAAVVAYMFKKLAMQDWLLYCQRHGMPGIVGKTNFNKGSDGWNNLVEAVASVAADFSCVTNKDDEIDKLDVSQSGELPYPPLVERMDRTLAALMRGADLSSMSAHHTRGSQGGGQGASLQGKEEHIVETDDANFVSETLQRNVDARVIEYYFGPGVKPLAKAVVVVPEEQNVSEDIEIDEFLIGCGIELGKKETAQRYGRTECKDDDEPVEKAPPEQLQPPKPGQPIKGGGQTQANETQRERMLVENADRLFEGDTYQALRPLADRVIGLMEQPDDSFDYALHKLREDLPGILREINREPRNAKVLRDAMAAGWFNGVVGAEVAKHQGRRA